MLRKFEIIFWTTLPSFYVIGCFLLNRPAFLDWVTFLVTIGVLRFIRWDIEDIANDIKIIKRDRFN
jgi:hypothetical protein